MPHWLIIAIAGLWVIQTLWLLCIIIEYTNMTAYQQKVWSLNWIGNLVVYTWIPFTIFWWSWVIFG